jgi:hypothetical protein
VKLRLLIFAVVALAAAPVAAPDEIAVTFPAVSIGGRVDVGTVSARRGCSARGAVVRQRVVVRLVSGSGAPGFARLRAALAEHPGALRVRVDGVLLSTVPRLVDAHAPIGRSVARTIELEVPASEPPGALTVPITWTAEAD